MALLAFGKVRATWQALSKDFAESFYVFAEGCRLSTKKADPVVNYDFLN